MTSPKFSSKSQNAPQNASGSSSPSGSNHTTAPGVATTGRTTTRHVPWTKHAVRQVKLVVPGAAVTYYLGTLDDFWKILHGSGGSWAWFTGWGASGLAFVTIALFLYVLLMPWMTGEEPNYQSWRESGILSSVIPVLTGSIVIGWLLAVSTLGQWSSLGYLKGTIGVSALYAMTFGLLGLIPVPRVTSSRKRI
ncbi:hypothetical protein GALMADRAFT_247417 [Galerina marginata CBS 339.88]|uniref:Uncharacterized protein n=1 Tax=Galerina marginata (strain CBS 339.88) TaxID=685588 RepID=A0A067TB10_GALM3|nr:hypothetical protein GALMADRAFT_247417 [Galerina marginata CBS 339.88]